jgi:hypothetical protein
MIVYFFAFLKTKSFRKDSILSSFKIKEFALLLYCLVLAQLQNVSLFNRLVVIWPKF